MVSGFTKFKERFQGFENQYVIIGGTACDLIMENEELSFRATKDVDIVLIVESITAEFGRQFWEYVKEAGYEHLKRHAVSDFFHSDCHFCKSHSCVFANHFCSQNRIRSNHDHNNNLYNCCLCSFPI